RIDGLLTEGAAMPRVFCWGSLLMHRVASLLESEISKASSEGRSRRLLPSIESTSLQIVHPKSPQEQGLRGVQAGLRLVPNKTLWSLKNLLADFFAPMGRETMQHDSLLVCVTQELCIQHEAFEGLEPRLS